MSSNPMLDEKIENCKGCSNSNNAVTAKVSSIVDPRFPTERGECEAISLLNLSISAVSLPTVHFAAEI